MNSLDIVVAFGGDILGVAVGASAAFELVGFLVIAMTVVQIITGAPSDFITFPFGLSGPYTGGFAAGVAAMTYTAEEGKLDPGRGITAELSDLAVYDVLLVGGVSGAVGYITARGLNQILAFPSGNIWTDTVALTVMVSGVVSRLVFSKTGLLGKPEQGIRHYYPPWDKCWIPYHSRIPQFFVPGLDIGLMTGFLSLKFGDNGVLLTSGISTFSLIFLHSSIRVPMSHYISLPTALVAVPSGGLVWAAIVGIICAVLGELVSRTSLIHGDTRIDSPAMVITIVTTMINLSATTGLFTLVPLFQSRHSKKPAVSTRWLFVMCVVTGVVLQLWRQKND